MEASLLALMGDPRLIEMGLCLAVIGVLRWIDLMR